MNSEFNDYTNEFLAFDLLTHTLDKTDRCTTITQRDVYNSTEGMFSTYALH